jgi:hypothetical protein
MLLKENNQSLMNLAINSFEKFSILEKKGDLKKLAGLKKEEDLEVKHAKKIGKKVANMEGQDKKKYVGIINFLGASCDIYNALWKSYTTERDRLEKKDKKD